MYELGASRSGNCDLDHVPDFSLPQCAVLCAVHPTHTKIYCRVVDNPLKVLPQTLVIMSRPELQAPPEIVRMSPLLTHPLILDHPPSVLR